MFKKIIFHHFQKIFFSYNWVTIVIFLSFFVFPFFLCLFLNNCVVFSLFILVQSLWTDKHQHTGIHTHTFTPYVNSRTNTHSRTRAFTHSFIPQLSRLLLNAIVVVFLSVYFRLLFLLVIVVLLLLLHLLLDPPLLATGATFLLSS